MHFSTLFSAAFVAVATLSDVTTAHVVFVDAYGNASPHIHGFGLGHHAGTTRKGNAQYPQQRDIAVFNQRPVHNGWWKGDLRNGCGTSILSVTQWYQKYQPAKWNGKGVTEAKRKALWKQAAPKGAYIDIKGNINWLINSEYAKGVRTDIASGRKNLRNGIPKVTANGVLNVLAWQVNIDGGGHFKCRIDYFGNANQFSVNLKVTKNCAGNAKSIHAAGSQKTCWFKVAMPANLNCRGSYNTGKHTAANICIVRCENSAKNGPFGGCIPIQQVRPAPPKPIVVTVRPPPRIVTVTRGNFVTVSKGDVVAVPKTNVVTVTKPQTITVTAGQVITITVKGTPKVSTCTKKGVITITNESRVTVTQKSTVTVPNNSVVTVTEDSVVTITKAPEVVTKTSDPTTVTALPSSEADPEDGDANKAEPTPEGTKTLTPEEIEAAKGEEDIDPEDLEEAKNEKVDDKTKEELQEEAKAGGKGGEELPDEEVEEMGYY
ncbi:uncharacterized protein DFL_003932 [Arthrobotrys flagrans]|uniref:Uncharacterized protein n=1 Tax=Arthrobotrys flagrans TaxID=97331 RepID=A0A437A391_ARTFL|nr:hypothetical protein DFL_003932 [Arthrobotrys flagrans]